MALKAKDRAVNIWFAEKNARVVHQIARRKIVGAIYDDVEILEKLKGIFAGEFCFEGLDLNVGVEVRQPLARRFALKFADIACAKSDLPLKIREIHDIEIDESQTPDTGGSEIKSQRGAQPPGANQQDFCVFEFELTLHAHFGHDQVAAIAKNFLVGKTGGRLRSGLRLCSWPLQKLPVN